MAEAVHEVMKAMHKASASLGVFLDEFPHIAELDGVREISIKLADVDEADRAIQTYVIGNRTDFEPVKFAIWDTSKHDFPILMAAVHPERGFVVSEIEDVKKEYLVVTLPEHHADVIAKLEHPNGVTLCKVCKAGLDDRLKLDCVCCEEKDLVLMIEESALHGITSFDKHIYKMKETAQSELTLASIWPKNFDMCGNSYLVDFENCDNHALRSIALGVGLALTLSKAYIEIANLLRESILE